MTDAREAAALLLLGRFYDSHQADSDGGCHCEDCRAYQAFSGTDHAEALAKRVRDAEDTAGHNRMVAASVLGTLEVAFGYLAAKEGVKGAQFEGDGDPSWPELLLRIWSDGAMARSITQGEPAPWLERQAGDDAEDERREEIARVLELVAKEGLDEPRALDGAIDTLLAICGLETAQPLGKALDAAREEGYRRGRVVGLRERRKALGGKRNEDRREVLAGRMLYLTEKATERDGLGLASGREKREASALEEALRRWDAFDEAGRAAAAEGQPTAEQARV